MSERLSLWIARLGAPAFRRIWRYDRALRRKLTAAGLMAVSILVAAAVFGFNTREAAIYQLFGLAVGLLAVAAASSLWIRLDATVRRELPRIATVGVPFEYALTIRNAGAAQSADFLVAVQQAARAAGALLILDEVITLRLSTGGAQQVLGLRPDLTAMGKIIGGGFPVGAVGGREELLALCDPSRPRLFHSGTFNGNPVTTAAGLVSLQHLDREQIDAMSTRAAGLEDVLAKAAADAGLPLSVRRAGSMLQLFFSPSPPAATFLAASFLARACQAHHPATYQMATGPNPIVWKNR